RTRRRGTNLRGGSPNLPAITGDDRAVPRAGGGVSRTRGPRVRGRRRNRDVLRPAGREGHRGQSGPPRGDRGHAFLRGRRRDRRDQDERPRAERGVGYGSVPFGRLRHGPTREVGFAPMDDAVRYELRGPAAWLVIDRE